MSDLDVMLVHFVTIETMSGHGAYGRRLSSASDPIPAWVSDKVRHSPGGTQVTSTGVVIVAPEHGSLLTAESRVTLPTGRTATVSEVERHTSGSLGLPDHVKAVLL